MEASNEKEIKDIEASSSKAGLIEITFYTDPLCCWSWGFEPQWRKLQYQFHNQLRVRYVMSGLLPSWNNYNDPLFSVSRPSQMGPVWLEASRMSGMIIQDRLWVTDPPASSYPACIAVKCAGLQSDEAGLNYLRLLREAVMLNGQNIAKQEVLTQLAHRLNVAYPRILDVEWFEQDLTNDNGLESFRKDWQEVQNRNITRFPTLIIKGPDKPPIMITGYRPYPVLLDAIKQAAPNLQPETTNITAEEYAKFWGSITRREVDEVLTQKAMSV